MTASSDTSVPCFWRLLPGLCVTADRASPLAAWMGDIFGRMRTDEPAAAGQAIRLECVRSHDGRLTLVANGVPCFSAPSDEEFPPLLETVLVSFAARRREGILAFHAAGAMLHDRFVLMPGSKGSGKSTLSVRLASRDGMYFGDELIFFDPEQRKPLAYPKAAALKEGSFKLFSVEDPFTSHTRGPLQYLLPDCCAACFEAGPFPSLIAVPSYVPESTLRVTTLTASEAAVILLQQCFGGLVVEQSALDALTALAAVPACIIEYGHVDEAVEVIENLCGEGS